MNILWISSLAWKTNGIYPCPVSGAGAVSGSLFQQSMIEGLENLGHIVDIISDYPYADGSNVHGNVEWSHNYTALDVAVKTIDIPYYSLIYKAHSLKKVVRKKIREKKYDFAIAYLIHQPYMDAISYAKNLDSNVKTVLICPDLPDMMDMSLKQKLFKTFLKKMDMKRITNLYKRMDGFVLFAEAMQEKINVENAKYTVIEGVAAVEDLDITRVKKEKFIIYAGTLHPNIGIENIIESLDYIDDKTIKLKIYGTGALQKYIKDKVKRDSRIIYGGFIDRKDLFEEQKKAIALINARNPSDAYTKYSFPSKTFEYLYSGTPFITTILEGVPDEYRGYLFEIEDNNPKSIANGVNKICLMDSKMLIEHAHRAQKFITSQKTMEQQSKRLDCFLTSLNKGEY